MKKETIKKLRLLINKAYDMSNDSRISLYIRVMELLDYYDENISIERKMQIKKEYGIGDDRWILDRLNEFKIILEDKEVSEWITMKY